MVIRSWSGMGPLFGVFFGATVTLGYGILRLGMGRVLALMGTFGGWLPARQAMRLSVVNALRRI